jgi:hypothetical protein
MKLSTHGCSQHGRIGVAQVVADHDQGAFGGHRLYSFHLPFAEKGEAEPGE